MTNRTESLRNTLLASTATLLDRKVWSFSLSQLSHVPLPPPRFYWGVGIENCWIDRVNPAKDGKRRLLDMYLQMQHYERWKQDLQLARDVGVNCIRYRAPGTTPNSSPGHMTGHRLTSQSVPRQQTPDHGLQNRASDGEAEMVVAQKRDWPKRFMRGAERVVVRRQSTSVMAGDLAGVLCSNRY